MAHLKKNIYAKDGGFWLFRIIEFSAFRESGLNGVNRVTPRSIGFEGNITALPLGGQQNGRCNRHAGGARNSSARRAAVSSFAYVVQIERSYSGLFPQTKRESP